MALTEEHERVLLPVEEGVRAVLEAPRGVDAVLDPAEIVGVDPARCPRGRRRAAAAIVAVPDVRK